MSENLSSSESNPHGPLKAKTNKTAPECPSNSPETKEISPVDFGDNKSLAAESNLESVSVHHEIIGNNITQGEPTRTTDTKLKRSLRRVVNKPETGSNADFVLIDETAQDYAIASRTSLSPSEIKQSPSTAYMVSKSYEVAHSTNSAQAPDGWAPVYNFDPKSPVNSAETKQSLSTVSNVIQSSSIERKNFDSAGANDKIMSMYKTIEQKPLSSIEINQRTGSDIIPKKSHRAKGIPVLSRDIIKPALLLFGSHSGRTEGKNGPPIDSMVNEQLETNINLESVSSLDDTAGLARPIEIKQLHSSFPSSYSTIMVNEESRIGKNTDLASQINETTQVETLESSASSLTKTNQNSAPQFTGNKLLNIESDSNVILSHDKITPAHYIPETHLSSIKSNERFSLESVENTQYQSKTNEQIVSMCNIVDTYDQSKIRSDEFTSKMLPVNKDSSAGSTVPQQGYSFYSTSDKSSTAGNSLDSISTGDEKIRVPVNKFGLNSTSDYKDIYQIPPIGSIEPFHEELKVEINTFNALAHDEKTTMTETMLVSSPSRTKAEQGDFVLNKSPKAEGYTDSVDAAKSQSTSVQVNRKDSSSKVFNKNGSYLAGSNPEFILARNKPTSSNAFTSDSLSRHTVTNQTSRFDFNKNEPLQVDSNLGLVSLQDETTTDEFSSRTTQSQPKIKEIYLIDSKTENTGFITGMKSETTVIENLSSTNKIEQTSDFAVSEAAKAESNYNLNSHLDRTKNKNVHISGTPSGPQRQNPLTDSTGSILPAVESSSSSFLTSDTMTMLDISESESHFSETKKQSAIDSNVNGISNRDSFDSAINEKYKAVNIPVLVSSSDGMTSLNTFKSESHSSQLTRKQIPPSDSAVNKSSMEESDSHLSREKLTPVFKTEGTTRVSDTTSSVSTASHRESSSSEMRHSSNIDHKINEISLPKSNPEPVLVNDGPISSDVQLKSIKNQLEVQQGAPHTSGKYSDSISRISVDSAVLENHSISTNTKQDILIAATVKDLPTAESSIHSISYIDGSTPVDTVDAVKQSSFTYSTINRPSRTENRVDLKSLSDENTNVNLVMLENRSSPTVIVQSYQIGSDKKELSKARSDQELYLARIGTDLEEKNSLTNSQNQSPMTLPHTSLLGNLGSLIKPKKKSYFASAMHDSSKVGSYPDPAKIIADEPFVVGSSKHPFLSHEETIPANKFASRRYSRKLKQNPAEDLNVQEPSKFLRDPGSVTAFKKITMETTGSESPIEINHSVYSEPVVNESFTVTRVNKFTSHDPRCITKISQL